MTPRKLIAFLIVITCHSLWLTACEFEESKNSNQPSLGEKEEAPVGSRGPACYLNSCFETTSAHQIHDPAKDYVYPDSQNFPNEALRPQYIAPAALLDLTTIDPKIRVAQNFYFEDFMSKQKGRYGLYSADVVTTLQLIRNALAQPIIVTSGYRSPGYNRRVDGSAQWSRHTYGDAVDFLSSSASPLQLKALCDEFKASYSFAYQGHVHCDWRKAPLDPAFYEHASNKSAFAPDETTTAKMMALQSRILIHSQDGRRLATVETPDDGDHHEDIPIYQWEITLPSGEILRADTPTVLLPEASGEYKIRVVVGGAIELEELRIW